MPENNKYDLVLINPPTQFDLSTMTLGLLTIASYVRQKGFCVTILDGSLKEIKEQILRLDLNNSIVGLSATTDVVLSAADLCKFIKGYCPAAFCILGGFHATALPEETLLETDFDMVVFGEGEMTVAEILQRHKNNEDFENIAGTVIRNNGTVLKNPSRLLIKNLDILPFPAYDLVNLENKFLGLRDEKVVVKRGLPMLISRGCPYDCVFCGSKIMWQRTNRWHSIEYVINQIEYLVKTFYIDGIEFLDDELLSNKKNFTLLIEHFLKSGLAEKIKWECQSRVTSVDEEKLIMLKQAGCRLIRFGIESGSSKILEFLKCNRIKIEDCYKAVQLCKKVGLSSFGTFILGSPEESLEDIVQTIEFIEKSGLSLAAVFVVVPYPGTDLFSICKEKGYLPTKIKWSDFIIEGRASNSVIKNRYFTPEQLQHIRDYINLNIIRYLTWGQRPRKLNHRKELEKIINGDLRNGREALVGRMANFYHRGLARPDKIIPFVSRKMRQGIRMVTKK